LEDTEQETIFLSAVIARAEPQRKHSLNHKNWGRAAEKFNLARNRDFGTRIGPTPRKKTHVFVFPGQQPRLEATGNGQFVHP
jgi:hypothetical protein